MFYADIRLRKCCTLTWRERLVLPPMVLLYLMNAFKAFLFL
jgi:lipid A disaccharide synthetase